MATIDDISDVAVSGDQVSHLWVNDVGTKVQANITNISTVNTEIDALQALNDAFKLTIGAGLTVNYLGGPARLANGTYAVIAPGSVVVPASSTSFIFINEAGAVVSGTQRPLNSVELGIAISNATVVTSVTQTPIRSASTTPLLLVDATKTGTVNLLANGTNYGVPGWTEHFDLSGIFDNGAGIITVPATARYRFEASALIASSTASLIVAKMSLYGNAVELKVLDELSTYPPSGGGANRMILNGVYETPIGQTIATGVNLTLQIQLRGGTDCQIFGDANTSVKLWRVS